MRFYKIPLDRVVVFHDELDLAPGRVRMKKGGGAGGHNGLRDIDAHVGNDYRRVRIGIGHPGHKDLVLHWVLRDFEPDERDPRTAGCPSCCDALAEESALLVEGERQGRRALHEPGGASRAAVPTCRPTTEDYEERRAAWVSTAASSACPMSASRPCSTR